MVEVGDGFGRYRVGFAFRVVDADKPFISETGYKSHYETFKGGRTVEQVAIAVFSACLVEGRRMLAPEYRERFAVEPCRPWLAPAPAPAMPAELEYEEPGGQLAFGF
ncbi:MAG: stable inheritance protein [Burkholderia sp.]